MVKAINLISPQIIDQSTSAANLIALLLINRQVINQSDFLSPPYPVSPLSSSTLKKAVKLIHSAIRRQQHILIYGDYDVDGVTATAILWQSLYKLYPKVTPFIPHREKDGYGIKADSFFRFQREKGILFDLLITVDNGIVAQKELKKIKDKQAIKIIITDHHLPPSGRDVINHVSTNCTIHSTAVSGAGISWFLAREFNPDADLGLAALGAVADCLPLTGINRTIVVHGLNKINNNPSLGLKKLVQISGIQFPVSSYHLGYLLGPRINAVGRLADPTDALRLLCSQNSLQASRYAQSLNNYNQDRQLLQKESLELADKNINPKSKIIFIFGNYNPGIIGLIAGRLTEKYYLPSVVIGTDGDIAKGSCRSIPELNIIKALRQHSDLFIDLGGHALAAGFSILTKNIPKLEKQIIKSVNLTLKKIKLAPHLDVDAQILPEAVNKTNIQALEKLAPFGIGNPEPLFLLKNLTIQSIRTIGQTNDHLKLKLNNLDAIAFKKGELSSSLKVGDQIDIIASLSLNTWNNSQTPQLIIKEIILPQII